MTQRIRIAHSPDSDDAFMFYALTQGLLDVSGLEIEHELADIETLNRAAFEGTYEITAFSFHAYAHLHERYAIMPSGASFGVYSRSHASLWQGGDGLWSSGYPSG